MYRNLHIVEQERFENFMSKFTIYDAMKREDLCEKDHGYLLRRHSFKHSILSDLPRTPGAHLLVLLRRSRLKRSNPLRSLPLPPRASLPHPLLSSPRQTQIKKRRRDPDSFLSQAWRFPNGPIQDAKHVTGNQIANWDSGMRRDVCLL